jgi:hypothetical protein
MSTQTIEDLRCEIAALHTTEQNLRDELANAYEEGRTREALLWSVRLDSSLRQCSVWAERYTALVDKIASEAALRPPQPVLVTAPQPPAEEPRCHWAKCPHGAECVHAGPTSDETEKDKAEHSAVMADAARFRWIDEHALTVDTVADPDNLVQVWCETLSGHPVTGRTLREAVDEAMRRDQPKESKRELTARSNE